MSIECGICERDLDRGVSRHDRQKGLTMEHPATFTMHTPSGPVHCCVKHARQIEGLMNMLGTHTKAVRAPDGAECSNCKNEAKYMPANAEITGLSG